MSALAVPSAHDMSQQLGPTLPLELQRWVAQNKVGGGLAQEALDAVYQHRSEDCRAHVRSAEDTRSFKTAPGVKEAARDALVEARRAFDRLDRGAIQTNDQAALELLGQGIETVSARGDKLVKAAGGYAPRRPRCAKRCCSKKAIFL